MQVDMEEFSEYKILHLRSGFQTARAAGLVL